MNPFGLIGAIVGIVQQVISTISMQRQLDNALSYEMQSISMYPHVSYSIMTGSTYVSGTKIARTHVGPTNVYVGRSLRVIKAIGGASRLGVVPFIPMISGYGITVKSSSMLMCSEQQQAGAQTLMHATVGFKAIQTKPEVLPIISLNDMICTSPNLKLISNVISSGLALGPAPLVFFSQILRALMSNPQEDQQQSDFAFAMNPASLQVYDRVE